MRRSHAFVNEKPRLRELRNAGSPADILRWAALGNVLFPAQRDIDAGASRWRDSNPRPSGYEMTGGSFSLARFPHFRGIFSGWRALTSLKLEPYWNLGNVLAEHLGGRPDRRSDVERRGEVMGRRRARYRTVPDRTNGCLAGWGSSRLGAPVQQLARPSPGAGKSSTSAFAERIGGSAGDPCRRPRRTR
jgi:hypothetical protein